MPEAVAAARALTLDRDPWWGGPVGWLLDRVVELPEPVPCSGALGLWRLPAAVEREVLRQLRSV